MVRPSNRPLRLPFEHRGEAVEYVGANDPSAYTVRELQSFAEDGWRSWTGMELDLLALMLINLQLSVATEKARRGRWSGQHQLAPSVTRAEREALLPIGEAKEAGEIEPVAIRIDPDQEGATDGDG